MPRLSARLLAAAVALAPLSACAQTEAAPRAGDRDPARWPVHDTTRTRPPVVQPGGPALPVAPPADAIVLFDGRSLDGWRTADSAQGAGAQPARWRLVDGAMEVVRGAGAIATTRAFGDVQLHVEWRAPAPAQGTGQNRANSGVFLMGRYEVQVLDSHQNDTYPDGQAGALYGQYPPLVNASRPPGEWQAYDIVFRRPRFDAGGRVVLPARVTVFHNGVLVQDAEPLTGPSGHRSRPPYARHADRLAIALQDHGDPVRFRNLWVRDLEPALGPAR